MKSPYVFFLCPVFLVVMLKRQGIYEPGLEILKEIAETGLLANICQWGTCQVPSNDPKLTWNILKAIQKYSKPI